MPTTPPPPAAQTPSAPPSPPTARTPSAPPSPPAAQVPATPPAPPASRIPGTPSAPPAAQSPATPPPAAQTPPAQGQPSARRDGPRRLEEVRGERHEERRGNQVIIREGDRTIIRQGDQVIIRRDEAERFRRAAPDARVERRGRDNVTTIVRPGGVQIVTVTDNTGRLIRRVRRDPRGREFVLIDNVYRGPRRAGPGFVIVLPPPVIRIPRERYIVDAGDVPPTVIYETLMAPPVERLDRRYTLDEIRYSPMVRDRMPRIDLDTITFETGSWEVTPDQAARLAPIADGIRRAIAQNPNEVFLVEGHTDAVGSDEDNLSLSDRRAESVALVLSEQFGVPPENLTAQGYGEQYLKVPSEGPERINRRVTVRRITPLLTGQSGPQ
ncbi:MAG: OmpA family protein [Pseudorhodoplanes sp.]